MLKLEINADGKELANLMLDQTMLGGLLSLLKMVEKKSIMITLSNVVVGEPIVELAGAAIELDVEAIQQMKDEESDGFPRSTAEPSKWEKRMKEYRDMQDTLKKNRRSYYRPDIPLSITPKYKVGDSVSVNNRREKWVVKEIASTGNDFPNQIGYWFDEQPAFPLYEHELSE